jgi:hypothetical protein
LGSTKILSARADALLIMIAGNIMCTLNADHFIRLHTDFGFKGEPSIDQIIGKPSLVKFLESALLMQLLILINSDMFDF